MKGNEGDNVRTNRTDEQCVLSGASVKISKCELSSCRSNFGEEPPRGSLNFKIPIKYRTETIRAGIRAAAVGKKSDASCRTGSHLGERSPREVCRYEGGRHIYMYMYVLYVRICNAPSERRVYEVANVGIRRNGEIAGPWQTPLM